MNEWIPCSPRSLHLQINNVKLALREHLTTIQAFRDDNERPNSDSRNSLYRLTKGTACPPIPRHDGREKENFRILREIRAHSRLCRKSLPQHTYDVLGVFLGKLGAEW